MGVVIRGEGSAGKTHLLRALVNLNDDLGRPNKQLMPENMAEYSLEESVDCLLILDDIEDFLGAADAEQNVLTFVDAVKQNGNILLITAKQSIRSLNIELADLSSRLQAMENFELVMLSDEYKRAVLKQRADQRGIILSEEVVSWLLTHTTRDLASLLNLLDQIDVASLAQHRKVTVPLIKNILKV